MEVDLKDRIILVTGAASGIGQAIAIAAAEAAAGGLLLTDRNIGGMQETADLIGAAAPVELVEADLAEPAAPEVICNHAIAQFGRIDGLVNAAGVTNRAGFDDGTLADWEFILAINARAPFFLMQHTIADMRRRNAPGSIVNIQSVNAHCGAPDLSIYSASKGALQTLTKNAANAHLDAQIRVNGINLGWTLTKTEDDLQANTLGKGSQWQQEIAGDLPLGRLLIPEEVARLAVYLLSDASAPMTGTSTDLEQGVLGAKV